MRPRYVGSRGNGVPAICAISGISRGEVNNVACNNKPTCPRNVK